MKKIIRSPEIDFGLPDEPVDENVIASPMPEKIYPPLSDYTDEITNYQREIGWEINADLNPELKREALELLAKGIKARKVAIHCHITIDKIKRL